ncbi:NAD-dependent succinate-semialdehyde dehydrogenase [Mycolicibacterium phlei]|uniref:NAD-dependent succinate-semialdehyde dehydrogenase n=1 Tax=Mycolicibacterium phlei TaxID=1771 RepID=UPI00058DB31D|nr:NAD-dependent succinate-semialdehyde dehydrogenase [Mycolicibacterium phlei]
MTTPVRSADPAEVARADEVIAGIAPPSGPTFPVHDPATGELIAEVADHDVDAALAAVERAEAAGRAWASTSARTRADVLLAWYDQLTAHTDDLAALITREMGKPLAESLAEVRYGTDFVRWYSEEASRPGGTYRELPAGGADVLVRRAPVGLSVLITPWNFPLAMATRKIAPALAAGCPVVIKPAELTPLTTMYAVTLAEQIGVPEGLINVVTTSSPSSFSEAVLRDPRVRKVSFTGSTEVGRVLLNLASHNVLRTSMELGGNAAVLVFDDADLDRAVAGTFQAKMRNGGQSCIAANRIFVQDTIHDAFVERLTDAMASVVVGNGFAPGVGLGPLIDDRAVDSMVRLVADAYERGAEVRTGGAPLPGGGYFFEPTVLTDVPADALVAATEIFGPVAAVQRFSTEDEAIARANATEFGLAGYVFTQNLDRALNVADRLETGLVGINQGVPSNAAAPFGGVKQSGVGREGSGEGLEEYQEVRFYNIARRGTA